MMNQSEEKESSIIESRFIGADEIKRAARKISDNIRNYEKYQNSGAGVYNKFCSMGSRVREEN